MWAQVLISFYSCSWKLWPDLMKKSTFTKLYRICCYKNVRVMEMVAGITPKLKLIFVRINVIWWQMNQVCDWFLYCPRYHAMLLTVRPFNIICEMISYVTHMNSLCCLFRFVIICYLYFMPDFYLKFFVILEICISLWPLVFILNNILTLGIWHFAISHLPERFCSWTYFQNIGFNMAPSDPFM